MSRQPSSERRAGERVTDAEIEAAITAAQINPEACEWYDGSRGSVVFRVTRSYGHFAERHISPWSDQEGVEFTVRRTAEDLEELRG